MILNGTKIEFNSFDTKEIERIEKTLAKAWDEVAHIRDNNYSLVSEVYNAMIDIIDNALDDCFGAGTAKKIFGDSRNVWERFEVANKGDIMDAIAIDLSNRITSKLQAKQAKMNTETADKQLSVQQAKPIEGYNPYNGPMIPLAENPYLK